MNLNNYNYTYIAGINKIAKHFQQYKTVKNANLYSTYGAISKTFGSSPVVAFNGQRKSTEISANAQTAQFWEYNGDVGRRWNVDPRPITGISSYASFLNNPIAFNDVLGDTTIKGKKYEGTSFSSATTLETVVISKKSKTGININTGNFGRYQAEILEHEGGFVNDPADPGGVTNKGIIFSNFRQWAKNDLGINPTLSNLKNLTDNQAAILYKKHYWDKIRGDEFKNGSVAFAIYDWSVTSGGAIKDLEKLFSVITDGITIDSKFSSSEVAALNKINAEQVFNMIQERRLSYYQELVTNSVNKYKEKHPNASEKELKKNTLLRFQQGWENRVNSIHFEQK